MPLSSDEIPGHVAERHVCPAAATPPHREAGRLRLREVGAVVMIPATVMAVVLKITGDERLALLAAGLTAPFALFAMVVAVSQPMLCALVQHLPEIMRTRSEGRSMEWVVKAAVCGPHKTAADAENKRVAARAYASDRRWNNPTAVGDMMRISRITPTSREASHSTADRPGVRRCGQQSACACGRSH